MSSTARLKRPYPEHLPRFRLVILGLVLAIVALQVLHDKTFASPSAASIVFALGVLLPASAVSRSLLAAVGAVAGAFVLGNEGLEQQWEIAAALSLGATALGTAVRKFLLGIEWQLASSDVLGALLDAGRSAASERAQTPDLVIEQALASLREYVRADVAIAARLLDAVTAEAFVCLPQPVLANKLLSPELLALALEQNRCLFYPDYPSTPTTDPVLIAAGTRSLAVLPLQNGKERGAILLIWHRRTLVSPEQQRFTEGVLGGLRLLLQVSETTFRFEKLESRYSSILETIPQGVVFVDRNGDSGWVNQRAAEILNLTAGAVEPAAISSAMAILRSRADNQQEIATEAAQFFSKPDALLRDWLWIFSHPQPLVLSLSSTPTRPVRDVEGRLWLLDDITDRYFNRITLAERSAQLEAANEALRLTQFSVDTAADCIFWIGPDAEILYVNQAACLTLGYSPAELLSMKVLEIDQNLTAENWSYHWRILRRCGSLTLESNYRTKLGRIFPVEVNVNYLEFNAKESHCVFARDISARKRAELALRQEQENAERLLLNILPLPIAKRLKRETSIIADRFCEVTILFADLAGFTKLAERLSSTELVYLLNEIFSVFDELTEKHGLEKIKTIGDAYMAVGGLPVPQSNHASSVAEMALDMQQAIKQFNERAGESFSIRIGINTGPVVAGVIGTKKFIYDLWGDAVNTASRMESHGIPGNIQVAEATYELLRGQYEFKKRGRVLIKGKGEMTTYWLVGRIS